MIFVDMNNGNTFTDLERDLPNVREIHLSNGRTFKLERRDPFGFVFVVWDKGPAPQELSGAYTDYEKARQAVSLWVNNKMSGTAIIVKEKVKMPDPITYKKKFVPSPEQPDA